MTPVCDSPRNCCSCFELHLGKGGVYKNWLFLAWKGPEVVVMRLAARTWTQLGSRSSVACQGQFWTITKAHNTGLVRGDVRSTARFTSALCSLLYDGVGFDTNILYERRYVGNKRTKRKVRYWNKVYRRRWEDKTVLRKGCVKAQTRVFLYRVRSGEKLLPSLK
jgi:hypothetical protein